MTGAKQKGENPLHAEGELEDNFFIGNPSPLTAIMVQVWAE
jgi:hypothetical protein